MGVCCSDHLRGKKLELKGDCFEYQEDKINAYCTKATVIQDINTIKRTFLENSKKILSKNREDNVLDLVIFLLENRK